MLDFAKKHGAAHCTQAIGTVLERRGVIRGTKGSVELPDFQQPTEMTIRIGEKVERRAKQDFASLQDKENSCRGG